MSLLGNDSGCPILGHIVDLDETIGNFPTGIEVLKCFKHIFYLENAANKGLTPSASLVCDKVVKKLTAVWLNLDPRAEIISQRQIKRLISGLHEEHIALLKKIRSQRPPRNLNEQILAFKSKISGTFNISVCKCKSQVCNCKSYHKRLTTSEGATARVLNNTHDLIDTSDNASVASDVNFLSNNHHDVQTNDGDYLPTNDENFRSDATINLNLYNFSLACDRYEISDRAAAALASALLYDVGIVSKADPSDVIDRSKVRRERAKARSTIQEKRKVDTVVSLFFDGRKDKTMIFSKTENGRWRRTVNTEEHICLIAEPGSKFLGHTVPSSGKSDATCRSITDYLDKTSTDCSKIQSVGCDGTNTNTGHKGGIIKLLEDKFSRSLQWLICLLHFSELMLRHMMEKLDGPTNGPKAFKGPIGKQLPTCHLLPVTDFVPIPTDLTGDVNPSDLSTDQQYMWRITKAVSSGICPPVLADLNVGPLNHSRFLTLACRTLRLYVASKSPSQELVELATFIMKVYAPQWFSIKERSSCTDGARHLFQAIARCRYLEPHLRGVQHSVIQHNGFFAHPENILLAMLFDEDERVRSDCVIKILSARKRQSESIGRRHFKVPTINFEANNYTQMADLERATEPPLTANLSEQEIWDIALKRNKDPSFKAIPCHTQAVERGVKLVTEAATRVCGADSRDGFIKVRLESREHLPQFDTKRQLYTALHE